MVSALPLTILQWGAENKYVLKDQCAIKNKLTMYVF